MGAVRHWSDVVAEMSQHPSTEAVYSTSATHTALDTHERYHPDTVARLQTPADR